MVHLYVLWGLLLCSTIFTSATANDRAAVLPLELFLEEVKSNNGTYQNHKEKMVATEDKLAEKNLLNPTSFILESNVFEDYRSSSTITVDYNHFYKRYFRTGLEKTFDFGLETEISFDFSKLNFVKTNPRGEKDRMYGALWLTLSQDFLSNSFGEVIKTKKKRIDDELTANYYEEHHNLRQLLQEAEIAYWRTVVAKEKKIIGENVIKNLQTILNDARTDANNSEKIIQTKIALQTEKLDLLDIAAREEELAWDFNNKRGVHSNSVKESLQDIPWGILENYRVSEGNYKPTLKLKSLEKRKDLIEDDKIIEKNKYKTTLKVRVDYCLNAEEHKSRKAFSGSFSNRIPYGFVGLRLAAPLDYSSFKKFNKALSSEENAAKLLYRQQYLTEKMEWSRLVRKLEETQEKLKLSRNIEKLQGDRLNIEREKTEADNKSLILQLQNDLGRSRANSLTVAGEILEILATLKLYSQ
jgi:hypothetical protein